MAINNSSYQATNINKFTVVVPSAIKTVNTTIDAADLTGVLEVIGTGGNIDCSSIATGTNGQEMELIGTSDTDTVTIKTTTTNVKISFDCILGKNDVLKLRYITVGSVNSWVELYRCNNPA